MQATVASSKRPKMRVVIVGGGVAGVGAALVLSRRGHQVTVVERDDTPMPETADEAFGWDRRGAPQVRQSHAFLGKLVGILRRGYPDVYAALLAEGATEMRFGDDLPPTLTGFSPEPGDDELVMLACRRTTFEWIVRRAALAPGRGADVPPVQLVTGLGVDGLLTDGSTATAPVVTGVRLTDGSELAADLVVIASGRRSVLPEWLAAIGAAAPLEEVDDTGIVYFSRFYRLRDGADHPARMGPIGGDLGYLKYGVFVGDNRTVSITLAAPVEDAELRKVLADPVVFDTCARALVVTAPYLDGRTEPITPGVHVMAGLLNRWREFVVDGEPLALGVIPIGDAVLCTNPLYGRGCSTGFWGAEILADSIDEHGGDLRELMLRYDARLREEILPWYRAGVQQDAEARRVAAALLAGDDPDGDRSDPRTFMRGVFRDGLVPALRLDAVVLRAFFRSLNLLSAPDAMATDPDIQTRVLAVWEDRHNRPPEPALGPKRRAELLQLIGV